MTDFELLFPGGVVRTSITSFLALTISLGSACAAHAVLVQSIAGGVAATNGSPVFLVNDSTQEGGWIDALNSGATRYMAFDWTINDNNGGNFFGGLTFFENNNGTGGERLLVGAGFADTHYGAGVGGTIEPSTGTIDYVVGDTVRIGLRLTTVNDDAGNDSWAMWVDPLISDEGSPYAQRFDWTLDDLPQRLQPSGRR